MRFMRFLTCLSILIVLLAARQQCFAEGATVQMALTQKNKVITENATVVSTTATDLKLGSTGSDVVTVQCKLEMTKDPTGKQYFKLPQGAEYGTFGQVTQTAVKKFQTDKKLISNGVVDTNIDGTWDKLGLAKDEFILAKGSKDENVSVLQQWLKKLDIFKYTVDGDFGTLTEGAVNTYKDKKDILNTDEYRGKVGKTTWGYIYKDVQELDNTVSATLNGESITIINLPSGDTSDPWQSATNTKQAGVTVGEREIEGAELRRDGTVAVNIADTAFELGANLANGTRLTDNYFEFEVYHYDTRTWSRAGYYKNQLLVNPTGGAPLVSVEKLASDLGFGDKITVATTSNGSKVVYIDKVDDGRQLLSSLSSLTVSLIPGIGDVKDIQEGVTGYDILTGQKLSLGDRCISVTCSFLPVISGSITRIGKKGMAEIDNVIEAFDDLSDAEKAAFRASTWEKNPLIRGQIIEKVAAKTDYNTVTTGWYSMAGLGYSNFPVMDFWRGNEISSLKTIDPRLYNDGSGVMKKLEKDLERLRDTKFLYTDANKIVTEVKSSNKMLDIRVPVGTMNKINLKSLESMADMVKITLKEF